MRTRLLLSLVLLLFLWRCDGGLQPPEGVEPGFSGTIRFVPGYWPPQDSLYNLWLFASQVYPLDSSLVFQGIISTPPYIFIYPEFNGTLASNQVDSVSYEFLVPAATYRYVGVVQRLRNNFYVSSLRVVGVYAVPGNPTQPAAFVVRENDVLGNIDIMVDFLNPPPQPF